MEEIIQLMYYFLVMEHLNHNSILMRYSFFKYQGFNTHQFILFQII